MKIRYYCVNCREASGAELDDNIILLMDGAWDVESQTWKAHGATADPYCGTCGSESTDTEEVPNHTPDPVDDPIRHDFHREMHEYRVQKGEIEE